MCYFDLQHLKKVNKQVLRDHDSIRKEEVQGRESTRRPWGERDGVGQGRRDGEKEKNGSSEEQGQW